MLAKDASAAADFKHLTGVRGDLFEQSTPRKGVIGEVAHCVRQARQPEFVEAIQPPSVEEFAVALLGPPPPSFGELSHRDIFHVLDHALRTIHDLKSALPDLEAQIGIFVTLKVVLVESPHGVEQVASHEDAAADVHLALARLID